METEYNIYTVATTSMVGPIFTAPKPVSVVRSKSCHVSRYVGQPGGKPKLQHSPGKIHHVIEAWASRRNTSDIPNRRPSTTYPITRSWHREGPQNSRMTATATGGRSTASKVQCSANSRISYNHPNSHPKIKTNPCNVSTHTHIQENPQVKAKPSSFVYITDGLFCRDLASRSLRGNPKLHKRMNQRVYHGRSKSFPLECDTIGLLPFLGRHNNVKKETVLIPSKEGYHSRSKSPTYSTLMETKDILMLELSKRIRELRRDLDGIKARENSAVNEHSISATYNAITGDNEWYIQMMDTLLEDDDLSIGRINNNLPQSVPITNLQFSVECLRSHITDLEIVETNIEEAERKINTRRIKDRNKSKYVYDVTTPELSPRIEEAKKMTSKSSKKKLLILPEVRKSKSKVIQTRKVKRKFKNASPSHIEPDVKVERDTTVDINTDETLLVTAGESTEKVDHSEQSLNTTQTKIKSDTDDINKQFISETDEDNVKISHTLKENNVTRDSTTPETDVTLERQPLTSKLSRDSIEKTVLTPTLSETNLEKKSLLKTESRVSLDNTSSGTTSMNQNGLKERRPRDILPTQKTDDVEPSNSFSVTHDKPQKVDVPVIEQKKQLTEKEKFLEMRKRMQERKEEQSKKRENFRDISMLGLSFHNQRERRGKLGNIIASKIDGMLEFGDNDDDDDEEDDDDESI
ncbi:uncharacterized protein [Antedon mediterranea]|uniref:uncharacterized protein n=1 Tax=Antedon mediterranea TaxID=105859 RepID=UPI003AF8423F